MSARGQAVFILTCLGLCAGAAYAAEFEVLDKFSVDGYSVLRGSVDIPGGLFTVGTSTLVVKGGNVGIGTMAPAKNLEIMAAGTADSVIRLSAAGNSAYYTDMVNSVSSSRGFVIMAQGADALAIAGAGGYSGITIGNAGTNFVINPSSNKFVLTGGSVGIGTTAPGGVLEIGSALADSQGKILRFTSAGTEWLKLTRLDASSTAILQSAGNIALQTASGNVGIGTTAPGYGLELIKATGVHLSTTATAGYGLYLNTAGNVGIGASGPTSLVTYRAEIYGTDPLLGLTGSVNGLGQFVGLEFNQMTTSAPQTRPGGAIKSVASGTYTGGLGGTYNSDLAFYTGTSGANIEQVRILSSGNVGIGTTGPAVKLSNTATRIANADGLSTHLSGFNWEVSGQGQTVSFSNLNTGVGNHNAGLLVKLASADATDKILDLESAGVNRVRVLGNGNVGIGTPAPTAKFQIGLTGTASLAGATIVKSTNFAANARFGFNGLADNNDGVYFGMGADGAGIPAGIGFFREASGWDTALVFYTNNITSGPNYTLAMQEKMRINSAGHVTVVGGYGDLAENHRVSGAVLRGSLVSVDNTIAKTAVAASPLRSSLLGVVSTKPGAVMDVDGGFQIGYATKQSYADEKAPIALVGATPALVTTRNGPINMGDAVGISSIPGFGVKMLSAGNTAGKALEMLDTGGFCQAASSIESIVWPEDDGKNSKKPCFTLPDGTFAGKIMVAVNVSWYDPGAGVIAANSSGNVGIGTTNPGAKLAVAGDVYADNAGSGVIVKSPDGTKCARIGISNTSTETFTVIACP